MARMQGAGAGDGRGSDRDKDREGSSNKQSSRRNEPAEIRGLREAAKPDSDSGVDRGRKDRPRIQREGGVRSHADVMRERRMNVYGETRAQASRIGADDFTRSAANKAWRSAVRDKMQKGTLSDFDRQRWVSDYGVLKSRAQIRADYETSHFASRADSAWNRGDLGDWAKFSLKSSLASASSTFEDLKSAPLDTLADLTRNPLVAGALSLTGIGAGGVFAVQAADTLADVGQGEVEAGEALRTFAADALDNTPIGEGLGIAKNVLSAGLRNPDELPETVAGFLGGQIGARAGTQVAQSLAKSNPLMAAAIPSLGAVAGKLGAGQLFEASTPAKKATEEIKTSPLLAGSPTTPKPKRTKQAPIGSEERAIQDQQELAEADALALVRDYQMARFQPRAPRGSQTDSFTSVPAPAPLPSTSPSEPTSQGPLPYYNTIQPYRMA